LAKIPFEVKILSFPEPISEICILRRESWRVQNALTPRTLLKVIVVKGIASLFSIYIDWLQYHKTFHHLYFCKYIWKSYL